MSTAFDSSRSNLPRPRGRWKTILLVLVVFVSGTVLGAAAATIVIVHRVAVFRASSRGDSRAPDLTPHSAARSDELPGGAGGAVDRRAIDHLQMVRQQIEPKFRGELAGLHSDVRGADSGAADQVGQNVRRSDSGLAADGSGGGSRQSAVQYSRRGTIAETVAGSGVRDCLAAKYGAGRVWNSPFWCRMIEEYDPSVASSDDGCSKLNPTEASMTRSIFDPTGNPERSGSEFTPPDADQISQMPDEFTNPPANFSAGKVEFQASADESGIAVSTENDGKVLTIRMTGKLHKADYAHFVPTVERAIEKHGKVRLLVIMRNFHGWDASALREDTKFDLKHFNHFAAMGRLLALARLRPRDDLHREGRRRPCR